MTLKSTIIDSFLKKNPLLGVIASVGVAAPWVITLRWMTEVLPRPVGYVDDLSAICLLTTLILAFRLLPKWFGRLVFFFFLDSITTLILSNDPYVEFYLD